MTIASRATMVRRVSPAVVAGPDCRCAAVLAQYTRTPRPNPVTPDLAGGFVRICCSDGADAGGLGALRAVADFELDLLVFFKGAEARTLDLRVVDKHIGGTVLGGDEAESLLRVEPLHSSLWHFSIFPFLLGAVHRLSVPRAQFRPPYLAESPELHPTDNLAGTAAATSILRKFDTNTEAATANSQPCSSRLRQPTVINSATTR